MTLRTSSEPPLAELVEIEATDKLLLPALYYRPPGPSRRLVIYLHGSGSSGIFTIRRTNAIAAALTASGTAFLGLQNRGAGLLTSLKYYDEAGERQRRTVGTSHELIAECVYDIDGAIEFALAEGYTELVLCGHSTGANKAVLYNYLKPDNQFIGFILSGGGDDTGLYYEELGPERFRHTLSVARQHVEAGRGAELAPASLVPVEHMGYYSYQSLVDVFEPDGNFNIFPYFETLQHRIGTKRLWREFKTLERPTLVLYGEFDEYCRPDPQTGIEVLQRYHPKTDLITYRIIPGGDHGCHLREPELAQAMADWVKAL